MATWLSFGSFCVFRAFRFAGSCDRGALRGPHSERLRLAAAVLSAGVCRVQREALTPALSSAVWWPSPRPSPGRRGSCWFCFDPSVWCLARDVWDLESRASRLLDHASPISYIAFVALQICGPDNYELRLWVLTVEVAGAVAGFEVRMLVMREMTAHAGFESSARPAIDHHPPWPPLHKGGKGGCVIRLPGVDHPALTRFTGWGKEVASSAWVASTSTPRPPSQAGERRLRHPLGWRRPSPPTLLERRLRHPRGWHQPAPWPPFTSGGKEVASSAWLASTTIPP